MKKTKKKMSKEAKIFLLKFFILLFIILSVFSGFVYFQGKKGRRLKSLAVEMESERLNNAVRIFKALEGEYPDLYGNENNLDEVKTLNKVSFREIYAGNELFALPEDLKNHIEEKNEIVLSKDGKGGWVYDKVSGKVEANLPREAYK